MSAIVTLKSDAASGLFSRRVFIQVVLLKRDFRKCLMKLYRDPHVVNMVFVKFLIYLNYTKKKSAYILLQSTDDVDVLKLELFKFPLADE